jgi:hypothetical protein
VLGNYSNAGVFTAGASSIINVGSATGGSWNATGGSFNASTGTVNMIATTGGLTLSGNMTGANQFNVLNFNGVGGAWSFGGNSADVAGNLTISNGTVTAPSTTLQIAGNYSNNGTFTHNGGTVQMNGTVAGLTLSGNMTLATSSRFNNLTFNGLGGSWTINANADAVNNFTVTTGTVTTPASHMLTIGGSWTNSGTYNAGAASTINVASNWANNGTFSANTSTVVMNATTTGKTLSGSMTGGNKFYALNFNGSGGAWSFGANSADVANNFTITLGTVTAPSTTLQVAGNWTNNGTFTHNGGTVNMNGTVAGLTLSGNMATATNRFNILTFNGVGGNWSFNNNVESANNFSIINGTVTPALAGTVTVGGSWLNNGTFTHNSSLVTMSGTSAGLTLAGNMTGTSSFFDLTFSGSGSWSFLVPNATVVDNFRQTAGTVTAPSGTLTVGANWNHTAGTFTHNNGTVLMTSVTGGPNTLTSVMTGANSFYNLTFNSLNPAAAWSFSANAQTANNLVISNGTVTAPSTLTIGGNYTNNGTYTHNNGTVLMNGITSGLALNGTMTNTSKFYNLTFNGVGGAWSFVANADVGNVFTISNGAVTAPSGTLQVYGNWANTGTYTANNGMVNLVGAALQTLSGNTTFYNLTLNNAAGMSISADQTINGGLTMTAGKINIGTSNLVFGPAAAAVSGTFSSTLMIVANTGGQVMKQMTGNGSFVFPIGDNVANYTPITINFTGGIYNPGAYYGVKVVKAKEPNNANLSNYLNRYWGVVTSGITSPVYAATSASYMPADVVGTEASLSGGQFPGALPWAKFAAVNTATHTFSTNPVNSITSNFTGITTQPPVITTVPGAVAICYGNQTTIGTTGTAGDPVLSYSWAPSTGLNSTAGTAVVAAPSVTTVYTVTITDGNGFTGISTTTVTVNPLPSIPGGVTSICTGNTATMVSAPAGGTWSSGNPFQASVNPVTGAVTGLSAGNTAITYSLSTGCYAASIVTVMPSPAGITGIQNVCVGGTTLLSDATPGGTWSASSYALVSIGSTTGLVTGLNPGTPTVTYTSLSNGCYVTAPVTVNDLPALHTVNTAGSSTGSYCAGGTGVDVQLDGSETGVNYQLYKNGAFAGTMPGSGFALDFGMQTDSGVYTIVAVNSTSNCTQNMTGSVTISINPLPGIHTVTGGGGYCAGDVLGSDVQLDYGDPMALYLLYNGSYTDGVYHPGTGTNLDFNGQTIPGTYTVVALDFTSGCTATMAGSVNVWINPLPHVDTVTGGGNYCYGGTGVHIGVDYTDPGVNYQLYSSYGAVSPMINGTAAGLDFGLVTNQDTYSVMATDATSNCSTIMYGNAVVNIDPLPNNVYTISAANSGSYCPGSTGSDITLSLSDYGIDYQLYNGTTAIGSAISGNSLSLDFGDHTAGSYTIIGTNVTTGCKSTMTGVAVVAPSTPPAVQTVQIAGGATSYCAGGTGLNVQLSNSELNVSYELFNAGVSTHITLPGTGSLLDFGAQTGAGNYTVIATNDTSHCTSNMSGAPVISINVPPTAYTVSGGGDICAGGTGRHIGLSYSATGVDY